MLGGASGSTRALTLKVVDNQFIFGGTLAVNSTTVNGGSGSTLDYTSYSAPVQITLASISSGTVANSNGALITSFSNIGTGNSQSGGTLQIFSKSNTITITGAGAGCQRSFQF